MPRPRPDEESVYGLADEKEAPQAPPRDAAPSPAPTPEALSRLPIRSGLAEPDELPSGLIARPATRFQRWVGDYGLYLTCVLGTSVVLIGLLVAPDEHVRTIGGLLSFPACIFSFVTLGGVGRIGIFVGVPLYYSLFFWPLIAYRRTGMTNYLYYQGFFISYQVVVWTGLLLIHALS